MPEFNEIRTQLHDARQEMAKADKNLLLAKEALKRVQAAQDALARVFDGQNEEHRARQERLERERKKLGETIRRHKNTITEWQETVDGRFAEFLFADPQQQVERLNDDTPFLLFPVRLETRFKEVVIRQRVLQQLWVRIYPDDCLVDSFEEELSESEIKAARDFWTNYWKAGSVRDQERGAWRSLVAALGSGRAAWVVQESNKSLVLADPAAAKPVKAKNTDVFLVIPTETAPAAAEKAAVETYWKKAWLADGKKALSEAAFAGLKAALLLDDAAAVALLDQWKPANFSEKPAAPLKKNQVGLDVKFLIFNKLADTPAKQTSWTQAPKAKLMPDRFVLILENFSGAVQEIVGRPIPSPLTVGVDPSLDKAEQLRQEDGELKVSESMKWMTDFERAIEWGMGFKINLTETQAQQGFRRITALGLRLSASAETGQSLVEELFSHHKYGKNGFQLLPQGTPTNNVENQSSGHARSADADADASFEVHFGAQGTFTETTNWAEKRDGQWLAEWLGISPNILQHTLYADGKDQCHARAMNAALWPATLGYLMDTMMRQVFDANPGSANFDDDAVLFTRWFFSHFVSGRGALPAIRIGRQPYGILPATDFYKMERFQQREMSPPQGIPLPQNWRSGMGELYGVLKKMSFHWKYLAQRVDFVGKNKDPHKVLLSVVGLHPTSVEYYQRYTLSFKHLANVLKFNGAKPTLAALLDAKKKMAQSGDDEIEAGLEQDAMWLLKWLGYQGDAEPDVLDKIFMPQEYLMKGPLVDDRPLSESEPVRAYTPPPAEGQPGKNYLQWLADAARTSHETLRKEEGFLENKPPSAILYLMLRHALMEGYADAGLRLYFQAKLMDLPSLRAAKSDPSFIHVEGNNQLSESRWAPLYRTQPTLTGSPDQLVVDHVTAQIMAKAFPARYVNEQIKALDHLQDAATAQLERAFAEHVDCVSYRLDAWIWGMKNFQLASMRFPQQPNHEDGAAGSKKGLYVGAYGWLEDVRPEFKTLVPKQLEGELADVFLKRDEPTLVTDDTNYGYIHAPSLNHGVTAAVLRNAHKSYATDEEKRTFAINLSSERVRLAMSFLEGIRNGQSLAALLGYHLERGLHDRYNEAQKLFLDGVIFDLRKAFPLVANRLRSTKDDDADIKAIEARNVVNGLDLVNATKQPGHSNYPFGKSTLPDISQKEKDAINEEVRRLLDIHDAIADLAMAEGVHQVGLGNYDRAAATLDSFGKATFPVEPEVAFTPRSGVTLTHRVGIHLETGLDAAVPATNPYNGVISMTPRARAEPAMNKWLAGLLPAPSNSGVWVTYFDGAIKAEQAVFVTQSNLQLQAIDLLHLLDLENEQALTEMDDRLEHFVRSLPNARPEVRVTIDYTKPDAMGRVTFFQMASLLKSLRAVALASRPLRPTDVALHEEATQEADNGVFFENHRVVALQTLLSQLDGLKNNLSAGGYAAMQVRLEEATTLEEEIAVLEGQIANPAPGDDVDALKLSLSAKQAALVAKQAEIMGALDAMAMQAANDFHQIALYGVPQANPGWIRNEISRLLNLMIGKMVELRDRWQNNAATLANLLNDYDGLPPATPDEERFAQLANMERLVSTTPTIPGAGDTPAAVLVILFGKKAAFEAKLNDVKNFLNNLPLTLAGVRSGIRELVSPAVSPPPPLADFDLQSVEMDDAERQLLVFAKDLVKKMTNLASVLQKQLDAANAKMLEHTSAVDANKKVTAMGDAAKTIFGDGFQMVPSFALSDAQADELGNATGATADLLKFQTDELKSDFPVDDWLYGTARVREKMKHLENVYFMAEAFGSNASALQPIQLPFRPNDRWLALQFRKPGESENDFKVDADRLLYTATYAVPFDKMTSQCGLLVDEWTEVIPVKTETTGLAFHFDRPNAEPPQVMLLAMPPVMRGHWQWADLVSSIKETFDMAKLRAVEPGMVDDLPYARFLPATMMTVTTHLLTISTNLAVNNQLYNYLKTS